MSKESALKLLKDLTWHEDLRPKFEQATNAQEFLAIAAEMGYEITTEELKDVVRELSKGVHRRRETGIWPWLRTVHWLDP